MSKQVRLEALKLAARRDNLSPDQILDTAELYFDYIENGRKVVELPPKRKKLHLPGAKK